MSCSSRLSINLRVRFYIPFNWGKLALFARVVNNYIAPVFIWFDWVLLPFHNRCPFNLPESRYENPVLLVSWSLNHKSYLRLIYRCQLRHAYLNRLVKFTFNEFPNFSRIKVEWVRSQNSPFKIGSIEKISIICNFLDPIRNFKVISTTANKSWSFLIAFPAHVVFHYLKALSLVNYLQFC